MPSILDEELNNSRGNLILSPIFYDLTFFLNENRVFYGQATIKFVLNPKKLIPQPILLDFQGKCIEMMKINKFEISRDSFENIWNGKFLLIPENFLVFKEGFENVVDVAFKGVYSNSSDGFFSQDIAGLTVIYSSLEPHFCCRIFPCFDQPNLKGNFLVSVIVPESFKVISNEILRNKQKVVSNQSLFQEAFIKTKLVNLEESHQQWDFARTPPISTYLFQLIAGHFKEIKCAPIEDRIPVTFYATEIRFNDLQKEVEKLYRLKKSILLHYETFCGHKYPFSKCDSVFVPNCLDLGMETVGAIIYDEGYLKEYIKKEKNSEEEEENKSEGNEDNGDSEDELELFYLMGHEISHSWFGNMVTMDWWDDLWLNESFADFAVNTLFEKGTNIPEDIRIFLKENNFENSVDDLKDKLGAYYKDKGSGSHPIKVTIDNADKALDHFDSITYRKGASIVAQLFSLMGKEFFCLKLKEYFETYKWKNAKSQDFLQVFSDKSMENESISLEKWFTQWVCTIGYNQVEFIWSEDFSSDLNITVIQKSLGKNDFLRFHKLDCAFFDSDCNFVVKEIKVLYFLF